ncbi:hypothetical protein Hanom_Chr06g00525471 [Helianthus anomalus]
MILDTTAIHTLDSTHYYKLRDTCKIPCRSVGFHRIIVQVSCAYPPPPMVYVIFCWSFPCLQNRWGVGCQKVMEINLSFFKQKSYQRVNYK